MGAGHYAYRKRVHKDVKDTFSGFDDNLLFFFFATGVGINKSIYAYRTYTHRDTDMDIWGHRTGVKMWGVAGT